MGLAVTIPQLGLFVAFLGSFSIPLLGIVFPVLMDICVCYANRTAEHGRYVRGLMVDIPLILFGLSVLIIGSSMSIFDIIKAV